MKIYKYSCELCLHGNKSLKDHRGCRLCISSGKKTKYFKPKKKRRKTK